MRTFKNYKKDFLTGEVRDLILFVNELKSLPKDKDGWSNLSSIVTNILSTPISSIFFDILPRLKYVGFLDAIVVAL